jgi:hypothetical protein
MYSVLTAVCSTIVYIYIHNIVKSCTVRGRPDENSRRLYDVCVCVCMCVSVCVCVSVCILRVVAWERRQRLGGRWWETWRWLDDVGGVPGDGGQKVVEMHTRDAYNMFTQRALLGNLNVLRRKYLVFLFFPPPPSTRTRLTIHVVHNARARIRILYYYITI